jgi:transglutaminase-like putative cysteine protease
MKEAFFYKRCSIYHSGGGHMNFRHHPAIKIISAFVLFFFTCSFGGVFDIAYAIQASSQHTVDSNQGKPTKNTQKAKTPGSEEKFQKAIEDIEQALTDTTLDTENKKGRFRAKKSEIESFDTDIKKQFTETEKKLKDSGMPSEILDRHHKFVKHYDDNLKELKKNLEAIDKAKDKKEIEKEIEKTRKHLEKVNPPKKHKPLDPEKLPHRVPEIKEFPVIDKEQADYESKNPILVASAGSLDGLLAQNTTTTSPTLQSPPTAADLAETIEVKITPEITAKAIELGKNPVKIYEYVRNNFQYEPYYGSLKGAQQTLQEMTGNDYDQASLLIALLRASGIHARYISGTIELPIEKLMNWVGGVTNPTTAAQVLATAGVPGKLITEGGKIKYAQFEHCWVEAYVPYGNYRGAVRDDSNKTWIPLDPSFKQYQYKRGMDLYTAMGINGEQYIQDYITDTSPLPIPAELQDQFSDYVISPYQFYGQRLMSYIENNLTYSSNADLIGDDTIALTKTISIKEYPYLLGSLPYNIITKGATYSSLPDNFRHKIGFSIENADTYELDISYNVTLPEISGKRITLSYIPASSVDEALVNQYGGLFNVPAYLINVKPIIKVNGVAVAAGKSVGLGYKQIFNMSFVSPKKSADILTNKVITGDYSAIAIQSYKAPAEVAGGSILTLINNAKSSSELDELLGQLLYGIGISYLHHLNFEEELYAKNFQMIITREPSEAIVTSQTEVEFLFGVPYKTTEGGIGIDVDRNIKTAFPIDGDMQRKKDFMIVSGLGTSAWENMILQLFFGIPSVSAIKLLKIASQQNIPIYTIDSSNISTILPQLQVVSGVKSDIENAVNAGKKVVVSKTNIQYNDWNGAGYIILDPTTGAGAYMISGGLSGGGTSKHPDASIRQRSDWTAFVTSLTRRAIIEMALAHLDTPYIYAGSDPDCGFDCSGFVYYVFTCIYGKEIFGPERLWMASRQYRYLQEHGQLFPYSERLGGDIAWKSDLKHTGIFFFNNAFDKADYFIHAIGHTKTDRDDPNQCVITPPQCVVDKTKNVICGKYKKVVFTNTSYFVGKDGQVLSEIGRPTP